MFKKFLFSTLFLIVVSISVYIMLNLDLLTETKLALSNIQDYLKNENVENWDFSFQEADIASLNSIEISGIRVNFDYPQNQMKLKMQMKIEGLKISFPYLFSNEIRISGENIRIGYFNPRLVLDSNWLAENYPFVGLEIKNINYKTIASKEEIHKIMQSVISDIIALTKGSILKNKLELVGGVSLASVNSIAAITLRGDENNGYLLSTKLEDFKKENSLNIFSLAEKDLKSLLLKSYLFDCLLYVNKEVLKEAGENKDFPQEAFAQVYQGYLIKKYFKDSFVDNFLNAQVALDIYKDENNKNMFISNYQLGNSLAEAQQKETELRKILFNDNRVKLRPSSVSVKYKL